MTRRKHYIRMCKPVVIRGSTPPTCPPGRAGGRVVVHDGAMAESTSLLDDNSITSALADLPGWERDGDSIVTFAKLDDFVTAIAVVDRVAEDAESVQHHPDIDIRYNSLKFRLSTHSEGGLTAKDTDFAGKINRRVSDAGGSTQSQA